MKGVLSSVDLDDASLIRKAQNSPGLVGRDLVREVIPDKGRNWSDGLSPWAKLPAERKLNPAGERHVVALDFGMKWNIRPPSDRRRLPRDDSARPRRRLTKCCAQSGRSVPVERSRRPEPLTYAQETIRGMCSAKVPVFGICLGHQLLGLACGAKTFKLKFGHSRRESTRAEPSDRPKSKSPRKTTALRSTETMLPPTWKSRIAI